LERNLAKIVALIRQVGTTPVVFKDNAYFEPDLSQCILHKRRGWLPEDKDGDIPYDFVARTQGAVDAIIDRVKATEPQLVVIDPKKIMCDASTCRTYEGNIAFYKDANHINTVAARFLAWKYIRQESNPFAKDTASPGYAVNTY